ncbi:hypothetical protein BC361_19910 [Ensifer sp. LC54]|nr:hypothetical protein BC361_19910 [Ensifer sp. LC54]OCP26137.1 hypothetical protein BC363_18625 [Ensifer sp. LC384]
MSRGRAFDFPAEDAGNPIRNRHFGKAPTAPERHAFRFVPGIADLPGAGPESGARNRAVTPCGARKGAWRSDTKTQTSGDIT